MDWCTLVSWPGSNYSLPACLQAYRQYFQMEHKLHDGNAPNFSLSDIKMLDQHKGRATDGLLASVELSITCHCNVKLQDGPISKFQSYVRCLARHRLVNFKAVRKLACMPRVNSHNFLHNPKLVDKETHSFHCKIHA